MFMTRTGPVSYPLVLQHSPCLHPSCLQSSEGKKNIVVPPDLFTRFLCDLVLKVVFMEDIQTMGVDV